MAARPRRFSFYDFYEPYPKHVNYWNRRFVEDTWGASEATGYRPLFPARFGTRIEDDVVLSQLATLQGRRVDRIVVRAGVERLPESMLTHLRAAGGGILAV